MAWYSQTHWRVLCALALGLVYGVVAALAGWGDFTADWIEPFGTIFLRLLLLIAVPLVLASLITGIASLSDLQKLSRIGGKTILLYVGTTLVALVIGLGVVNLISPGRTVPDAVRERLQETYRSDLEARDLAAAGARSRGPLQALVDVVPDNILGAATDNRRMLSIVFVAFLVGTALMLVPKRKARPLLEFFESVDAVIVKIVELVIIFAPVGVFALIAGTVTSVAGDDPRDVAELLAALGLYCFTAVLGMAIHMLVTYPVLLKLFTRCASVTSFLASSRRSLSRSPRHRARRHCRSRCEPRNSILACRMRSRRSCSRLGQRSIWTVPRYIRRWRRSSSPRRWGSSSIWRLKPRSCSWRSWRRSEQQQCPAPVWSCSSSSSRRSASGRRDRADPRRRPDPGHVSHRHERHRRRDRGIDHRSQREPAVSDASQ